ncbi:MAG: hypothetical protein WD939_02870 [Dehalococcoidia bacterium]
MYSLVVMVLHNLTHFDAVMAAWRAAGAPAITILDSVGSRELSEQAQRDDLPMMPTIRDLLQAEDAPRKTLFSVVEDQHIDAMIRATEEIVGHLSGPEKGILFVVPTSRVVGYRRP